MACERSSARNGQFFSGRFDFERRPLSCDCDHHLGSPANASTDFALVRSKDELQQAVDAHCNGAMIVSDDGLEDPPEAADCPQSNQCPRKIRLFFGRRHHPISSANLDDLGRCIAGHPSTMHFL